ncbi:MAG: rod shape-determining protein MreD [Ignavibacteria bacterium]|nr:rod shape-determining protein MreD [Ignavibacteria bacterium]
MKVESSSSTRKNVYLKIIYYAIVTLLICVLQLSFSFLISIDGITPDLVILLVIWITLYDGKIVGLTSAFFIGLLYDYLSMNVLGINALTKTLVAYFTGFFFKENEFWNIIKNNKIFIIIFFAIFFHNAIYYLLMMNLTEASLWSMYFKYLIGCTAYTFAFSLLAFFFRIRKFW